MYPEQNVYLAQTYTVNKDENYFSSQDFKDWLGSPNYLGDMDDLSGLPYRWLYIGWDYNPVITRLQKYIAVFGISTDLAKEGRMSHLDTGWIWHSDQLQKTKEYSVDHYNIYSLDPVNTE